MVEQRESYSFHQLDMVEHYAQKEGWEFYRAAQEEIVLAVEGPERFHSIKLVWFSKTNTLQLQSAMNMEPPKSRLNEFYNLINQINRILFYGKFTISEEDLCLTYQTHLLLAPEKLASKSQIWMLVNSTVTVIDNFLPAFTDIATSNETAREILQRYNPRRQIIK